jgi:DeoR/GlpR family transcriptional regulator of sugar metabolism
VAIVAKQITMQEAAETYGVSTKTIRRYIAAGAECSAGRRESAGLVAGQAAFSAGAWSSQPSGSGADDD